MLLSHEEIIELSGYKRPSSQIDWLRKNGIKFLVGCDGKPRVLVSQLESVIGANLKPTKRRAEPSEEALNKFMGLS